MEKKKIVRLIRIKVLALLTILILFLLALQTPWIKNIARDRLIQELENLTSSKVRVESCEGIMPLSYDLYNLSFEFKEKKWLEIQRLSLNRSLVTLLLFKNKAMNLTVYKATLYSIPNFNPDAQITEFKWPKIPFSSLKINLDASKINIQESAFNLKVPQNLSTQLSIRFKQFGKVFNIKSSTRSDELDHVSLKTKLRGHQSFDRFHAEVDLKDHKHNLIPFYFGIEMPSIEAKLNLSGSPDAFLSFFNPEIQTQKNFRGSLKASAFPSVQDNDILSCLLNKKELKLDSEMVFDNEDGLVFTHVDLEGQSLLFNGQIGIARNYDLHHSYLEGEVRCLDFTGHWIDQPLEGDMRTYMRLIGHYNNPKIIGELRANSLIYKHFMAYDINSDFEYGKDQTKHTGRVNIKANLNQSPFIFTTSFDILNSNSYDLRNLEFSYGENLVKTQLLQKRGEIYQSTVDFDLQKIALFSTFIKKELHGDLKGEAVFDIDISPSGTMQIIDTQVCGSFIQLPKVNLSHFDITVNGKLPWSNYKLFQGDIYGSADLLSFQQYNWDQVKGFLNFGKKQIQYKVSASGDCALLSSGDVHLLKDEYKIHIRSLSGSLYHEPYDLMQPTTLEKKKNQIFFSPISLKIGNGQLYVSNQADKDDLNLTLKKFPLHTLSFFLPGFDMRGNVNLQAGFENISSSTSGSLKARFHNLSIQGQLRSKPYQGQIHASLEKRSLKGSLILYQNKKQIAESQFDLPLAFTFFPFKANLSMERKAELNLDYTGWLDPFTKMYLPQNHLIDGFVSANLHLKGPLNKPNMQGYFNLHRGYYENLFLGLVLNHIEMNIDSKKHHMYLKHFVADDGLGGKVSANGNLQLNFKEHLPYEIGATISEGQVIQFDFLTATFLGKLQFKGNLKRSFVSGNLKITDATVEIPGKIGKGMPILPVTYLYPKDGVECQASQKETPFPVYFDLKLDVLDKTRIRGRGLDSLWYGSLQITGSDQDPIFKGKLESKDGTFSFAGRSFELQSGLLSFAGKLGKDTYLNLNATHDINQHLISATLKGPLLAPYLTFRSEPPLEKRKILSLVLFGQEIEDLGPFQAISLTHSLATLSGVYTGPDLIDKIRKGVGLDQLSLGSLMTSDKDYTTVQIGKYITRGILVTLNRPISLDPAPFIITAYFRGGFQFQTFFDQEQIAKLQVQWRLNY